MLSPSDINDHLDDIQRARTLAHGAHGHSAARLELLLPESFTGPLTPYAPGDHWLPLDFCTWVRRRGDSRRGDGRLDVLGQTVQRRAGTPSRQWHLRALHHLDNIRSWHLARALYYLPVAPASARVGAELAPDHPAVVYDTALRTLHAKALSHLRGLSVRIGRRNHHRHHLAITLADATSNTSRLTGALTALDRFRDLIAPDTPIECQPLPIGGGPHSLLDTALTELDLSWSLTSAAALVHTEKLRIDAGNP